MERTLIGGLAEENPCAEFEFFKFLFTEKHFANVVCNNKLHCNKKISIYSRKERIFPPFGRIMLFPLSQKQ